MATILVVDDDTSVVNLLREDLQMEGHDVLTGYDGQMAIQLAKTRKPHLIIMDVNMPLTSGLKALQSLRQLPETKLIPILLLTGEPSAKVYPTLESQPRMAFLKKPVDLDHLNSMVKQFIQQYPR